jgi:hypothetical protein
MAARYDGFSPAEQASMQRAFETMKTGSAKARKAILSGDLAAIASGSMRPARRT